jgi:DNA-directed DNA polymerase III PolC
MSGGWISLRNHSTYSILDSTLRTADIVEAAAAAGMPAAGLTDTNTLAGAVQFYKQARAAGVHPVIGSEVRLESGGTLLLLVESAAGYANLCRLLTLLANDAEGRPSAGVTAAHLHAHSAGLIALCGPKSPPGENELLRLREIFGRAFALEVSPHHEEDKRLARQMVTLSRRHRIALVATVDTHYLRPEDRLRYDITQSMRTLSLLSQRHPDKTPPGAYHFHTHAEIESAFAELPRAVANARTIAERCRFDFELGDILFPRFDTGGAAPERLLREMSLAGLQRRYGDKLDEPMLRLERELRIIEDVGYAEYFLIFADIVAWCARNNIATLARGSAAGSLVCYTLGISNVCPFRFGLMFERFLNKERMQFQKLADIDLDLPWDERDRVIDYVFERYGRDHVAAIGACNTFQGRAAVADIAKVYGLPEREVRRFTENLPMYSGDPESVVREMPECRHLPVRQEPYKSVLAMARDFDGVPRHFTMHPCGLVISASPIAARMPLFRSAKGLMTTHYAMDDVEELGLLKMDLLGQAGLSVLRETRRNLTENRGLAVPDSAIDETDPVTWNEIARGNMRGVFHIESPNMHGLLRMTDCRDIECLTAIESVIRPGAANEGRKRAFARRHQGLEPVTYAHPSLEPVLADSYGLLIYEEHILLVSNGFAGMPWGRADMLRRALVKNKDHKKIDQLGEEFFACALARGRTPEETAAVWEQLRDFAGYMFNKAHSAAYAVEAFQGAWLKVRYPIEFLASVMTNRRGFYAPIVYVLETLRNGGRFLPPDLHTSDAHRFLVQGREVRLPLDQIKGLGAQTIDRILEARPFRDAGDFYRKSRPARDEWMALLRTGALDCLAEPRGRLFWRLCRLEANAGAPNGLFESETPPIDITSTTLPQWEQELLGFPISEHPLDFWAGGLDWTRFLPAAELLDHPQRYFGERVDVCGLVVADRIHATSRGAMKFVTLADYTGLHEVCLFPEVYNQYGHLTIHPVLAARVLVEPFDNRKGASLNAEYISRPPHRPRQSAEPAAAQAQTAST